MLRKSSAGCSLTNLWQMLLVNATSRIFFFLHPKSNPVDGLCVGGPGVFACSSLQMSAGDMICHADSQPAVCLITAGQPNAWPSSGRGPGGGSGGSIIHLHPCLCIMARRVIDGLCTCGARQLQSQTHTQWRTQLYNERAFMKAWKHTALLRKHLRSHPDTRIHYTGLTRCMVYCPNTL